MEAESRVDAYSERTERDRPGFMKELASNPDHQRRLRDSPQRVAVCARNIASWFGEQEECGKSEH